MKYPTRKAILIGCPGESDHYLEGVEYDLSRKRKFLRSERGGQFNDSEIETLLNPSFGELTTTIHGTYADYLFVYFSGHGYTDEWNNRMLSLGSYNVVDERLLNHHCPRQLVIVDACRNYLGEGPGAISGIEQYHDFTGSPARQTFDYFINASPAGKMIVHATASGTFSYDTGTGGVFSRTLLDVAKSYVTDYGYAPVGIRQILDDVCVTLHNRRSNQVPQVVYSIGDLQVPFLLAKPEEKRLYPQLPERTSVTAEEPSSSSSGFWLGVIGVGLLIWGLGGGNND